MADLIITVKMNDLPVDVQRLVGSTLPQNVQNSLLERFFNLLASGAKPMQCFINAGCVLASQTFTGTTVVATNTAVVNGTTFTAVASGASGNQFNVGANDTETMKNLAVAINASVTNGIKGNIKAVANASVVTVYALNGSTHANAITTTATGAIVAGGATLAGGTVGVESSIVSGSATPIY